MASVRDITPVPVQRDYPHHYPDYVKELAFLHWVQVGGNAVRALRSLTEVAQQAHPDEHFPSVHDLPSAQTIASWARQDDWEGKLLYAVAEHYPSILAKQAAKLIVLTDRALALYDRLLDDSQPIAKGDSTRQLAARDVLLLRGLAAALTRGDPLVTAAVRAEVIDMQESSADPAERQRERLQRHREERERRRRENG